MAKSLRQWLGSLVETELAAVVNWNNDIKNAPKIKNDPDSRFSDDGSNFRSEVGSPPLSTDTKVQLIKVNSSADPATVLLSDGHVSIRAALSADAVAVLEDELEEKLSLEMKGDVLSLTGVTIVSQPFGFSISHVQLFVDEWQYQYHLRKAVGDPKPIEEQQQIGQLIQSIERIRTQIHVEEDAGEDAPSGPLQQDHRAAIRAAQQVSGGREDGDARAHSQGSSRPGSSMSPRGLLQSQARIATQLPPRKKARIASLAEEGFEVEAGVNLSRPSGPNLSSAQQRGPAAKSARPVTVYSNLLNLLGVNAQAQASPGAQPVSVDSDLPAEVTVEQEPSETASQAENELGRSAPPHTQRQDDRQPRSSATKRTFYARRRIPHQQQRLFEKEQKQAWFPSLPGHQFPTPNVPIELLQYWNTAPSQVQEVSPQQPADGTPVASNAQQSSPGSDVDNSTDKSDSSSDEEVPQSQWPPTPTPPKRDMLPPDSTVGSAPNWTQGDSPHKPLLRSPAKPPSLLPDSSHRSSSGTPRFANTQQLPLRSPVKQPPLPTQQARPSTAGAGDRYFPSYASATRERRPSTRDRDDRRQSFSPRNGADRYALSYAPTHPRERPTSSRVNEGQRRDSEEHASRNMAMPHPRRPERRVNSPRSSGQDTVIKGTQFSGNGDDMELDVPRPLQDPALLHRQRRSEHFKGKQRRAWLQLNYIVSYESTPYISTVHKAYVAAHPGDAVELADFKQTVDELYPTLGGFPPRSLAKRKDAASFSQSSSVRPVSRHLDESNDADDGARPGAVEKESKPSSNGAVGPTAVQDDDQTSFAIYEDPELRARSAASESVRERASPSHTRFGKRMTQQPPNGHQKLATNGKVSANGTADYQDAADDTQETDHMPTQPATVFEEWVHAWRHLRPGGAFAKPDSRPSRVIRRVNVLSWDF
ncbi:hypothetical protein LTR85_009506 [Meristemomyces frigidus]|nr:hypothetical protein LTR85_009506 [Meristemomyces frigidus]